MSPGIMQESGPSYTALCIRVAVKSPRKLISRTAREIELSRAEKSYYSRAVCNKMQEVVGNEFDSARLEMRERIKDSFRLLYVRLYDTMCICESLCVHKRGVRPWEWVRFTGFWWLLLRINKKSWGRWKWKCVFFF